MRSQIHLIRHGITEGNQRRLFYGATDVPLAAEGVRQLAGLAAQGVYPHAENSDFYTTGLLRTEQTLEAIYGSQEHERLPELREMNFGVFEMKTHEDLKEMPEYLAWINDKSGLTASPGGESIMDFQRRIAGGLQKLIGRHRLKELSVRHCGKDAVSTVICHGGTISAIMETLYPGERSNFFQWCPDPGHGMTLTLRDGDVIGYESF